jgi:hypothetical protein
MVIITLVHTPLLIKDFSSCAKNKHKGPMVLGDLKLDKNKPPYLPSKVDWVREREREREGL